MIDANGTTPGTGTTPGAEVDGGPLPRLLCDTAGLPGLAEAPSGALWKPAESGRQLDANVVHLEPHRQVDTHAEPDLDVLLLVLDGSGTLGTLGTERGPQELAAGRLLWLPRGSSRSLTAGAEGLRYLTVHRRRPGLQIRGRADRAPDPLPE